MKRHTLVIVACLFASLVAQGLSPAMIAARKTTHAIEIETIAQNSGCSATAVGPHALLTATHCELGSEYLVVDGKEVTVVRRLRDYLDHTIFLVSGITFADYATIKINAVTQGDTVFMFGNPGSLSHQMRVGMMTGDTMRTYGSLEVPLLLFDMNTFFGDSGSALFNQAGEIVAVQSSLPTQNVNGVEFRLTGCYPLGFKPSELAQARSF